MSSMSDWLIVSVAKGQPQEEGWQMAGSDPAPSRSRNIASAFAGVNPRTRFGQNYRRIASPVARVSIHAASAESILA
jgi:hypothetical protein